MPTLTLPARELQAGDVLTAVTIGPGSWPLPVPRTVEGTHRGDGAVRLERPGPNPHGIEWWIYPDQADAWTVERPAAEPEEAPTAADPIGAAGTLRNQLQAETGATLAASLKFAEARGAVWVDPAAPRRREALATLASIGTLAKVGPPATIATVGDAVALMDGMRARAGLVVEATRGRLRVEYATPTAVRWWRAGRIGRTFRPWVRRADAYMIPAGSHWERSIRRALAGPQD